MRPPLPGRDTRPATLAAASALIALAGLPSSGAVAPERAAAAILVPPNGLRVASVGVHRITLRWKDRSRGERRYEVARRARGERRWSRSRLGPDRQGFKSKGLERGTVHEHRGACKRGRCSRWSAAARQATLLARFNAPHPDLRCEVLPPGDELNRDVSADPLHPASDQIIARILADGGESLHPDFGSKRRWGIPYAVVPGDQPRVPVEFAAFGEESDPGPYPLPPRMLVEGTASSDGDRHALVVRRPRREGGPCRLYELYRSFYEGGRRNRWSGDSGAVFDLGTPLPQRPEGWTSADAAGLPIFPGLVTYEEVRSGEIDHAIRITFERTRRAFIAPATHLASDSCNPDRPPMGLRLRLEAGYDISAIRGDARVIAEALRRYGAIVADNGSNWFISGSTDRRWKDGNLDQLKSIPGSAFEVVRPASTVVVGEGC